MTVVLFEDTEPTRGSADPIGDDVAERHSGWGALQECCAPEGGVISNQTSTGMCRRPGLAQRIWRWLFGYE